MDFGLFNTWNAVYEGGNVPWDPRDVVMDTIWCISAKVIPAFK
jgi:hypothetical protein